MSVTILRGDEIDEVEAYRLFREYVVHEDNLINHRVGWFIQLHSFLIASYVILVAAIMSTFYPQSAATANPVMIQAIASAILIGIAIVGYQSSTTADRSINAATLAIEKLRADWDRHVADLPGRTILPYITGGGSKEAEIEGMRFHRALPRSLRLLWIVSIAVPVAFHFLAIAGAAPKH